jgi:RNA polymerase sigma factor (sigma-70 family)
MDWLLPRLRRIEKRLRRLLHRHGRTPEDSDDLIQESLLRLHEYCRSREVIDHEAFLVRTAKNLSIDRFRREHRHLYVRETVEELEVGAALADEGPSPDEIVTAQKRLQAIGSALEAISPRTRDIYFAHRAGYSYLEIGAHLHVSKSTIEKHIARAVLALMDLKEPE